MLPRSKFTRIACILIATVFASDDPAFARQDPAAAELELPWAVKLGARAFQVECSFPVVSRVVLVPDGEMYLDEVSKWSPSGRWPVLFEDDHLAPMFIRRFGPKEIIRREIGRKKFDSQEGEELEGEWSPSRYALNAAIVRAWGGDPENQTTAESFVQQSYVPPGVVVASTDDPAWTAAVALAAGRGQPLVWLDGDFGAADDILDDATAVRLIEAIDTLIDDTGYEHDALGDTIDAITLCREVGGGAQVDPSIVVTDPRLPQQYANGPRAITDLIGRANFRDRYAYTGWIFGNEGRAAYMAMCSLFLDRSQAMLIHTYPDNEQWNRYHINPAATMFDQRGYEVTQLSGELTGSAAWRRMLPGGVDADLLLMNTKGGTDYFDLFDQRASPHDVPVLNTPIALHLIHSWSLRYAMRPGSVGASWLDRGAYAMVGSVHEPYLGAFTPPAVLAQRLVNYVPLLVAARWWDGEGPFADPWRINTIGDPLMTCSPPPTIVSGRNPSELVLRDPQGKPLTRRRIDVPATYGTDLIATMPDRMRAAANDESGDVLGSVIADLILIGRDNLAVQMWNMAIQRGLTDEALAAAAAIILPAIFRTSDADAFVNAFARIATPIDRQRTMLWHLLSPRIGTRSMTDQQLRLLVEHPRRPLVHLDLERIAADARNRMGVVLWRSHLETERAAATDKRVQDAIDSLLESLN